MTKNDLIKQCKFYRGEKKNPYLDKGDQSWFWDMERVYVKFDGIFKGITNHYKALQGKVYPDIPFNLLMIMFTSWAKMGYIDGYINQFYELINVYLSYPQRPLPRE